MRWNRVRKVMCAVLSMSLMAGGMNVYADSEIYAERVAYLQEQNIRGMDVSSYISMMDAFDDLNATEGRNIYGYKDYDGKILSRQGFFDFLASQGVNYIRVRVWTQPYNSDGKGYGGGNSDLEKALEIGTYATKANMKVLIDFHYSDFWADPGKQQEPKAWKYAESISEKAALIKDYTSQSLKTLLDAGVDVGMVQIGNETNGKFCGVTGSGNWSDDLDVLFDAGCDAVHETGQAYGKNILAVLHFTNPEKAGLETGYAANLSQYDGDGDGVKEGVSYDVFATSYYPYWHGSIDNLHSVLGHIAYDYNKYVMVAETSYANTLEDTDGHPNTVAMGSNDTGDDLQWSFSEQGQVSEFRDVLGAVVSIHGLDGAQKGLGAFYWEGAWIALQNTASTDQMETVIAKNKVLWEKYGAGWAASYSGEYDPEDAGVWFGGSAVDNQAFFDADGNARASLLAFDYKKSMEEAENILQNGGFEAGTEGWVLDGASSGVTVGSDNDPKEGSHSLHFWKDEPYQFRAEYTQYVTEPGIYRACAYVQGGADDVNGYTQIGCNSQAGERISLNAVTGDGKVYEMEHDVELTGWLQWKKMTVQNIRITQEMMDSGNNVVTISVVAEGLRPNVWGTIDEVGLYKISDEVQEEVTTQSQSVASEEYTTSSETQVDTGWEWSSRDTERTAIATTEKTTERITKQRTESDTSYTREDTVQTEETTEMTTKTSDFVTRKTTTERKRNTEEDIDRSEKTTEKPVSTTAKTTAVGKTTGQEKTDYTAGKTTGQEKTDYTVDKTTGQEKSTSTIRKATTEGKRNTEDGIDQPGKTTEKTVSTTKETGRTENERDTAGISRTEESTGDSTRQEKTASTTRKASGQSTEVGRNTEEDTDQREETTGKTTSVSTTRKLAEQSTETRRSTEEDTKQREEITGTTTVSRTRELTEQSTGTRENTDQREKTTARITTQVVTSSQNGKTTENVQDKTVSVQTTEQTFAATVNHVMEVSGIQYVITKSANATKGTVCCKSLVNRKMVRVVIPATVLYQGKIYQVTEIGASAFKGNSRIREVVIGKNVTRIGKKAFYNGKNLKKITVKTTKLKNVGNAAFQKISAKAKIILPKGKTNTYKKLLLKKGATKKMF